MSKTYLPYEPDQQMLLPAALQEWAADHLARTLSRTRWTCRRSPLATGNGVPPYHRTDAVKVLLYGYCVTVASSRRMHSVRSRHRIQGVGAEQHTGLPDHLPFRKD